MMHCGRPHAAAPSRRRWALLGVALSTLVLWTCRDAVDPRIAASLAWGDSGPLETVGAPGELLPDAFAVVVTDFRGEPLRAARVSWQATGGGSVVSSAAITDRAGRAAVRWLLGRNASEPQALTASVAVNGGTLSVTRFALSRPTRAARLQVPDTLAVRLGDAVAIPVRGEDQFGNVFVVTTLSVASADTAIVVGRDSILTGRRRGHTTAVVSGAGASGTVVVRVHQVAARLTAPELVRIGAIGDTARFAVSILDDRARTIADTAAVVDAVGDAVAARAAGEGMIDVIGRANGDAVVTLRLGTVATSVRAVVEQIPARVLAAADTMRNDALGDSVALHAVVFDRLGSTIDGAVVQWSSLHPAVARVDGSTRATTVSDGIASLVATVPGGPADTAYLQVAQRATRVEFAIDTFHVDALGATRLPDPVVVDRRGALVSRKVAFATADSSVVRVDTHGMATANTNGEALVTAAIDGVSDAMRVRVQQRAVRIVTAMDTLVFDALLQTRPYGAVALDVRGHSLSEGVIAASIADTAVVHISGDRKARSLRNGSTSLRLALDDAVTLVPVRVQQRAVRLDVTGGSPIHQAAAVGATLPLACAAFDGNNQPLTEAPRVLARSGRLAGERCDDLRVVSSGHDTLEIKAGEFTQVRPVVVAIRAAVERPLGDALQLDSMPAGTGPWAPSARVNTRGEIELYATGYRTDGPHVGDLHRYVSTDGVSFRYDGLVLRRDADPCAIRGSAVENVTVVPRSDSAGWRMFFAAGSFDCYGWQVFSAVSADERNWTIESGIRLPNGGTLPPDAPVTPPWPTGEGMEVDRLPDGQWRMIVSAYERKLPSTDAWQITEWRSSDQITWRYEGVVLHTDDMPREARASIYSPTIREVAPGLWRMIFTGDNRRDGDGRSRLWTALSTDKRIWHFEGELLGATGTSIYYSSLAADRVYFLRTDGGGHYLAQARVLMP